MSAATKNYNAKPSDSVKYGHVRRFVTTTVVVGMTGVASLIQQVTQTLKNPNDLSLMLVGSFLFDLLVSSDAMEFTPSELADHIAASFEQEGMQSEDDPDWHSEVVQELLAAIYSEMRSLLWVHVNATPQVKTTAVFQRMNPLMMEVGLMRLGGDDQ